MIAERFHRRYHAAMKLEVVVRIEDVVFSGIDILRCEGDPREIALHGCSCFDTSHITAVSVSTPGSVYLCYIFCCLPLSTFHQLDYTSTIGPGS